MGWAAEKKRRVQRAWRKPSFVSTLNDHCRKSFGFRTMRCIRRAAVAGLLRIDPEQNRASYIGVGNIGIYVYSRKPIKPISKNGILGYRLPTLLELTYTYDPGDLFVLYSDGVSSHFAQDLHLDIRQPPQKLAEQIVQTYGKQSDDATVVVVQT